MRTTGTASTPHSYDLDRIIADAADLGWTASELARRAKLSESMLALLRAKKRKGTPTTWGKLVKPLGVPLSYYKIRVESR